MKEKKPKDRGRLLTAALTIGLAVCILTCNDGLDEEAGLWLDGERIIHHHDTAVKTMTFPIGTNTYYEGGREKLTAYGTTRIIPEDTPDKLNNMYVPLRTIVERMYGNGLIINPNNGSRTGNDPSAKLTMLNDSGAIRKAELTLCKRTLILQTDWTTYTADGVPVEYGLRPTLIGSEIFINARGLQTWLPCNVVVEYAPGYDSPITGAKGTEMCAIGILATHLPLPMKQLPSPDGVTMGNINNQPFEFYQTKRALQIADNILMFQRPSGGWYKNSDMVNLADITEDDYSNGYSSLDNNTTYPQLRFLAQVISAGHAEQKYLAAFYRGLAFILRAQYDSGGWPQYAEPLRAGYYVNITYNDDAMIGVMEFLEDILNKAWFMGFVWEDPEVIAQVKAARDKGIECILNTQQRTDAEHGNVLTAWCQQHDPVTLAPADGRAYELPLLTPMESAEVVLYLMNIKNPGPRITRAIEGAAAWYKKTAKVGYITERIYDQKMINGDVRELIYTGNPQDMVWGRFYDLETGMQDVYTHRDGIKRYTFHETPYSTRHGYAFLNNRGMEVLAQYEVWRQRQPDKNYPQER